MHAKLKNIMVILSILAIANLAYASGSGTLTRISGWYNAHVDAGIPPVRIERRTNLLHGVWEYVGEISPSNGVNYFEPPAGEQGYYRLAVTNAP